MSYITLSKLFYSDKEKHKQTLERRLSDENAVRLPLDINGNNAFFLITEEILSSLASILRTDKKVKILVMKLPGKALEHFSRKCLIDEILITNSIEGVYSTRREIGDALSELQKIDKNKRFKGLAAKYNMLQNLDNIPMDTCEDIRALYDELVLPEISNSADIPDGKLFRKNSVSVYSVTQKEIHKGLTPESKIYDALKIALEVLHDEKIEILLRIAVFHYYFGYIHPFYDGNGRVSRFISSYWLSKALDPLVGYRISYTISENINKYYNSFKVCNDSKNIGDITLFLIMFMNIIKESMDGLEIALNERLEKLYYYDELLNPCYENDAEKYRDLYFLLIQASLFSENGISKADLTDVLKIGDNTLKKRLNEIEKEGLLTVKKPDGKTKFYMLDLDKICKE